MNQSVIAVGVGALLVGGVGGFVLGGGKSGGNTSAVTENARKSVVMDLNPSERSVVSSLAEVYEQPTQTARTQSMLDFYANLDPALFEEEARKLSSLPFSERILASYLLFSKWGETDPLAAIAHAQTMGPAGMFAMPTVLQSWASVDPQSAGTYYEENAGDFRMLRMMGGGRGRGGRGEDGVASGIATEWARQDVDGALAWAKDLENGSERAVASVISEVAREDHQAALEIAGGLEGDEQNRAYQSVAAAWAEDDWDAMSSWAKSLPEDISSEVYDAGVSGVAENLALENPAEAMDFLIENGGENALDDSLRRVVGTYSASDPAAARDSINALDDGDVRDDAVRVFARTQLGSDPESAVSLAATIADDERRAESVTRYGQSWIRSDEEAAVSYFESSGVVDAETLAQMQEDAASGGRGRGRGRGR